MFVCCEPVGISFDNDKRQNQNCLSSLFPMNGLRLFRLCSEYDGSLLQFSKKNFVFEKQVSKVSFLKDYQYIVFKLRNFVFKTRF